MFLQTQVTLTAERSDRESEAAMMQAEIDKLYDEMKQTKAELHQATLLCQTQASSADRETQEREMELKRFLLLLVTILLSLNGACRQLALQKAGRTELSTQVLCQMYG